MPAVGDTRRGVVVAASRSLAFRDGDGKSGADPLAAAAGGGTPGSMSRPALAVLIGLAGFLAYVVVVLLLADHVRRVHWVFELLFFTVAGVFWVWPAKRLMTWALRAPPR